MSDFNDNQTNEQLNPVENIRDAVSEPIVDQQPSFAEAQIIDGVEPAKKKSIFLIVAIIVVILAAASAAAYNFIPWVKNNVKMMINSPEDYYLWVEEQNLDEVADSVSEGYGKLLNSSAATAGEFELKADIDPINVVAIIEELTGESLSDSGIVLPSSIAMKGAADLNDDGNMQSSFQINAADTTLATMNMYMQDGQYYYQIPELSPAYVGMDLQTIMNEAYTEMDPEVSAFMETYMDSIMGLSENPDMLKDMLSEDDLNDLLVRYFTIIFENVDDVELEKGVSCEVNGSKLDYNMLSAEINEGALYSIVKDALKEAKKDNTIIKLIEKFEISKDDYVTTIDTLLEELGSMSVKGGDTLFTMNVYVDSEGKICGRDIEVEEEEDVVISYMTSKDGSDNAFDFKIMGYGEGIQVFGKTSEKSGKESGEAKVILAGINDDGSDVEFAVNCKDYETVDEKKGYSKGEISIDFTSIQGPLVTINLDSDGKSQTLKSDITVDGINYGTISFTSSEEVSMEIPAFDASQQVYQFTEDGAELEEYIIGASANLALFIENIGTTFGVQGLGSIFGAAIASDPTGGYTGGGDIITDNNNIIPDNNTTTPADPVVAEDVTYDFSKIEFKMNSQRVTIPSKIDSLLDNVIVDLETVEPDSIEFFYSEDSSFMVTVGNDSDQPAAPKDCLVTGFDTSDHFPVSVSIDGITIGSDISEVVKKYGVTLEDPNDGYVTIYDSASMWNDMTFFYYDGVISSFDVSFIEW